MFANQLNARAKRLCEAVGNNASRLDVVAIRLDNGANVLDFGTNRLGTIAGGIELARICMANLSEVSIILNSNDDYPLPHLQVVTDHPLQACIASQYAGWSFSTEHFFSMCSGPARLARGREQILSDYEFQNNEDCIVGILEAAQLPNQQDLAEFAEQCGRDVSQVTVCVARTSSLPGTIQVVARSVETALHKLYEMGFDLNRVERAVGLAPIPPTGSDDYQSMGWTNDAILYGADVTLWLSTVDDAYVLIDQLPSKSSTEFGKPFIEIFENHNRDFYQVDRLLFSPARITLNCVDDGKVITAGEIRMDLLRSSFGWTSE